MSYLKSLFVGLFVSLTSVAAMAFPTVSVSYPKPGTTLDDKYYFESFNVSASGVTVSNTAYATLFCEETGDEFESTMFKDFQGTILIKFDTDDITDNGEYTLTIPAGQLTSGSESNPALTFTYTLNDPKLGASQSFPQITFVSADPADGTKLAQFGGPTMQKISLKTSDDSAVNYISWFLYDVTDEANPIYVRQGNDNRYDLNRNGNNDDAWADGLYMNIGGEPEKLLKDHKYQLSLLFAGIGYDPATNQYPRPDQIEASTELKTDIYYFGLTDAPEYSPYTYVSVSPDPETYEIETAAQGMFTITYSGPVKPSAFNYAQSQGVVVNAGTWAPVGDADENGCCDKWEFTISPTVIQAAVGQFYTTIQTKDKDGLYVKGNGGYLFDDINYGMSWTCNVGAPDLTLVSPAENTPLASLSEIVVSNSEDAKMAMSYVGGKARILNMQGGEVRVLDDAIPVSNEDLQMKWTFEPITESGSYVLDIPKNYFNIGEETNGNVSKATQYRFLVDNPNATGAKFDLEPASVTPEDYSVVTELTTIKLTFAAVTFCSMDPYPSVSVYATSKDQTMEEVTTAQCDEGDNLFEPKSYTFTLKDKITDPGVYMIVIPKGTFDDEEYDVEMGKSGHANDELAYMYTIPGGEEPDQPGDGATFDLVPASVTPEDGATVTEIASVVLTFADFTFFPMSEGAPTGKLTKDDAEVAFAKAVEDDYFSPKVYTFTFANPVTEAGTYKFVVAQGGFCDEEYDQEMGEAGHACPELTYTFIIAGDEDGIIDIVAENGTITVYDLSGRQVLENAPAAAFNGLANGLYIINGVKVIKK
ncbi:MAG: T9SS type A sorting domain-containing protein [Bacteroides sp.]|nr:T9SS type A sorting domain-containing protein [Bacteroides sp.]MCM1378924.1 T9SS type A sorting domain-containing protein [Bacteroides sp.]MCM1445540.1 T9SS type A sorting domain-containing protein [Prevotella sp.]